MNYSNYASIYDDEYADYQSDAKFYLRWARRCPPPALELGCGTGRILFQLAQAGCPIWGLDSCQAMLDRARQRVTQLPWEVAQRIRLVQADMRDFQFEQEFGLVYLPFREFMHLESEVDQLSCLDAIHRHLLPNGRLIINLYDLDLVALIQRSQHNVPLLRQHGGDYQDPTTGHPVYLSSATSFEWASQMMTEERFYDRVDPQGQVQERRMVTIKQRWFFRWEMAHLLQRASFKVTQLWGGYDQRPVGVPGGEMIFVARPASARELRREIGWLKNQLARIKEKKIAT